MQRLEMYVDRQLWAGMMEQAVDKWWKAKSATTRQVGDTNKIVQVWRETMQHTKRHDNHLEVDTLW